MAKEAARPEDLAFLKALDDEDREFCEGEHVQTGLLEDFKLVIRDELAKRNKLIQEELEKRSDPRQDIGSGAKPYLYITADTSDLRWARELQAAARERTVADVMTQDAARRRKDFEQGLMLAAGVVFLHGSADRKFVDRWLSEFAKKTLMLKIHPKIAALYQAPRRKPRRRNRWRRSRCAPRARRRNSRCRASRRFARSCAVIGADKPPYPGLRPFERDESHLFFGRDDCVDQMIARLADRRFLAVLGSSGTGKSSLVKTGLFSGLEMGLLSGAELHWLIVAFRPGGNPLANLARALLEAGGSTAAKPPSPDAVSALQTRFKREGPRELIKWCLEGHLAEGTNLLILVDQFEELFRYQNADEREDAQALVSLLLESRWPRGIADPRAAEVPIYVTITMRSEYLGACALI